MRIKFILLVAFFVYFVSIFGGFIQDDTVVIQNDLSIGTFGGVTESLVLPYYKEQKMSGAYRPVTSLSFAINGLVAGKNAWGYRLMNVLLYICLTGVVYWYLEGFFGKLSGERNNGVGLSPRLPAGADTGFELRNDGKEINLVFLVTMLFTLHPIHTEAVNNIVGRSEILAMLLGLLALLMANKRKWEVGILILVLAVLAKESGIIFFVMFGMILWQSKSEISEKVGVIIYMVFSLIGYFGIRLLVLGNGIFSNNATIVENPIKFLPFWDRLLAAFSVMIFGVGKLIFPLNLSYDYSFNQLKYAISIFDFRVILGSGLIILSGLILIKKRNVNGYKEALMLFWLPQIVTGNFLFATGTIFGERLWLVPSLGFLMLVGLGVRDLLNDEKKKLLRRVLLAMTILAVVFFGGRTMVRNFDWLSQKRLFLHDAKYASGSVMAKNNEAAMYYLNKDIVNAKKSLDSASEIFPTYPQLMNNWGMYYLWMGDKAKAREKFEECLKLYPNDSLCKLNRPLADDVR